MRVLESICGFGVVDMSSCQPVGVDLAYFKPFPVQSIEKREK